MKDVYTFTLPKQEMNFMYAASSRTSVYAYELQWIWFCFQSSSAIKIWWLANIPTKKKSVFKLALYILRNVIVIWKHPSFSILSELVKANSGLLYIPGTYLLQMEIIYVNVN